MKHQVASSVAASACVWVLCCYLTPATVQTAQAAAGLASSNPAVCQKELQQANQTISRWAATMEELVDGSKLPTTIRESVHNEANQILDLIEDFGEHVGSASPSDLAKELVTIRRRSNKMALSIYLNTFDMRWPQNSLGLGVAVERVQQACLSRQDIQLLESPAEPLSPQLLRY